jgi:hypothetical protein
MGTWSRTRAENRQEEGEKREVTVLVTKGWSWSWCKDQGIFKGKSNTKFGVLDTFM